MILRNLRDPKHLSVGERPGALPASCASIMSYAHIAALPLALAALSLGACGAPQTLSAESYAQSCAADTDCVPVLVGDLCNCVCNYAAINRSDEARYNQDRARITCSSGKVCGPCQSAQALCTAGRCAARVN